MKELRLKDIAQAMNAACATDEDIVITGVSTDTRTIQAGDLFIALAGERFDAHDYIDTAVQNGAAAVVCSRAVESAVPVLYVDDTLTALHRLATYYRALLPLKVVGVTGSNGKTTTRDMTAKVLSSKYKVYSTAKNYNNEIGLPKSVLELDDSYEIAVLEMGMNHLGEISRLTHIAQPNVAMISNVGMAHIGNLGSQENILKAKLEILEGLHPDGLLIFNGDDRLLRAAETGAFEKRFIGIDSDAYLTAQDIRDDGTQTFFTVVCDGERAAGSIPVLGRYNVLNALEAICCGLHFGISVQEALAALADYQTVGMRNEAENIGGIRLVRDYYNSSPDSARVALETLGSHTNGGRKIAVLGEMLELGAYAADAHRTLAEKCTQNGLDQVLFIGEHAADFKAGRADAAVFAREDREGMLAAVKALAGELKAGDAVLIKGSRGMKMEEFCDALKELLTDR